jgi:EF hand
MIEILSRRWTLLGSGAFVFGLALLTSGCAGNSTNLPDPDHLYGSFDNNNDNNLSQEEWDQGYWSMDTNGDGMVSRDEFDAAMAGRGR